MKRRQRRQEKNNSVTAGVCDEQAWIHRNSLAEFQVLNAISMKHLEAWTKMKGSCLSMYCLFFIQGGSSPSENEMMILCSDGEP